MENNECLKTSEVIANPTSAPVEMSVTGMTSSFEEQQKKTESAIEQAKESAKEKELLSICDVGERASKSILEIIDKIKEKLNQVNDIISRFDPMPVDWTFRKQIRDAQDLLDTIVDNYESGKKETYNLAMEALTKVDAINLSIKKEFETFLDRIKNPLPSLKIDTDEWSSFFTNAAQETDAQMNIVAEKALQDGVIILNEINKALSQFKTDGTIRVDLLEEYDRLYQGSGIADQNEMIRLQKEAAKAELAKATAETAGAIQSAQDPGFFMSLVQNIIYMDPTSNPNFVYKTEKPANPILEQAQQVVHYIAYIIIIIAVLYFLSTKTIVVPFFQTFIFWFKRYFVFLAWLIVVGMIYFFMNNWFTWIIREDIRYIAFMINPTLHPGIHDIWHSKYKYWIRAIVYGLASLSFFLAAVFLTAIILFLIAPLFLLLMWASGQLMSYFEKEELDE
jgi:hypothetical protein